MYAFPKTFHVATKSVFLAFKTRKLSFVTLLVHGYETADTSVHLFVAFRATRFNVQNCVKGSVGEVIHVKSPVIFLYRVIAQKW